MHSFAEKYKTTDGPASEEPKKGVGAFLQSLKAKESIAAKATEAETSKPDENRRPAGSSPLLGIVEFLATLATNFGDSRIVVKSSTKLNGSSIRFVICGQLFVYDGASLSPSYSLLKYTCRCRLLDLLSLSFV